MAAFYKAAGNPGAHRGEPVIPGPTSGAPRLRQRRVPAQPDTVGKPDKTNDWENEWRWDMQND